MRATSVRRALFGTLAVLTLSSCAPTLDAANERGGVVRHTQAGTNMQGVLAIADQHCRKYGRVAQITGTDVLWSDTVTFNCVEP